AIYGDAGPNRLSGVDGTDDIRGAGGNDTILPGIGGTTTTTGGGGIDTLSYSDLANCSQLRLTIDTAAHAVDSSNASLCFLSDLHQTFSSFESFVGSRYKDVFDGGPANDTFHGGGSADSLLGRAGDDSLYGQGGNDTLNGGIGVDVCAHGPGSGNVVNCES
ncbi:MAG: calcium-binding protein, partial [Actinomycetota bacterium]